MAGSAPGITPTITPIAGASGSLSATEFSSAVTAITSAFGDPTRREIFLFAHTNPDGVTATEVAAHFDLHANVARHHLDKLAAGGYVEASITKNSATTAGRPSKRYLAVGDEVSIEIPVRTDEVVLKLLGKALAELGQDRAEALAEEVGLEIGAAMGDAVSGTAQRSVRSALHAVADALSAHGFAARAEHDGDQLQIVADHCPFGETAVEHPVMCAIDRGMVRGMLGSMTHGETLVDLLSSKTRGDDRCVTSVES